MLRRCAFRRAAELVSGIALSQKILHRVKKDAAVLSRPPCLAVVLVGSRQDSLRYTRNKRKASANCGIRFELLQLPETISQLALHRELATVKNDPLVDGVLLQLPLPPHRRLRPALFHIHPGKDVDGLHPLNAGNLFLQDQCPATLCPTLTQSNPSSDGAQPENSFTDEGILPATDGGYSTLYRRSHERMFFVPSTALAVRTLLYSHLNKTNRLLTSNRNAHQTMHAVVVNNGMIVGVPTAALLQKTGKFMVSICGRQNSLEEMQGLMRTADVLVTAYGKAHVFDASFVKPGAVIIDVSINEWRDPTTGRRKLCGDVDVASVASTAGAVTPTPGGVGPLTVAYLLQNTLKAARFRRENRLFYNSIYARLLQLHQGGAAFGCEWRWVVLLTGKRWRTRKTTQTAVTSAVESLLDSI